MTDREKELFHALWEIRAYFLRGDTSRWPEESSQRINALIERYRAELQQDEDEDTEE